MNTKAQNKPLRDGNNNPYFDEPAEFPRMLYRKTEEEERAVQTHNPDGSAKDWIVTNLIHGKLCETMLAHTLDEAEALSADGWETSPAAAYGEEAGLAAATSARDAEIADLRAQLAESRANERRGPGRPPKVDASLTNA